MYKSSAPSRYGVSVGACVAFLTGKIGVADVLKRSPLNELAKPQVVIDAAIGVAAATAVKYRSWRTRPAGVRPARAVKRPIESAHAGARNIGSRSGVAGSPSSRVQVVARVAATSSYDASAAQMAPAA